jgi:hypothetical protein
MIGLVRYERSLGFFIKLGEFGRPIYNLIAKVYGMYKNLQMPKPQTELA